jgi:LacI family transcriptional regulator
MGTFGQPTINDVALRAGVSNMTVSRVVNRKGHVSAKTRRRIEAAIAELGYQPNALAQGMRSNATLNIGFILPDLVNTANALVAQTAASILGAQGYRMVLGSTGFSPDLEAQFFSSFQQNTVDGIIAVIADETPRPIHELVSKSRVPIVIIDQELPVPVDTVYSEDRQSIRDAVHYLAKLGHRRIAALTLPLSTRAGRLRHQAYIDALKQLGLEYDPTLVRLRQQIPSNGYQATLELLRLVRRPTALIVAANQLTFGALQAIKENGLRIPGDISIIGSDEGITSAVVDPPLTVIAQDTELFGKYAAEFLLMRLEGNSEPARFATVPSQIILRQSCDRALRSR